MAVLRHIRLVLTLLVAAAFLLPLRSAVPQAGPQEYALKSVFLFNFCRFIEWPDEAFTSRDEPIVIGVIGEDPFGGMLEETVKGETLRGRSIRIERYRRPADIDRCHVLFVSGSDTGRFEDILRAVAGQSVVTVGETEAFLDRGGMIALTAERNRVRLSINPVRLRAENLVASSKLLQIAEIRR